MALQYLKIPGPRSPHTRQTTTLAGSTYVIHFDWVQRWGRWTVGLYTSGGTPIVTGIPLTTGRDLLAPFHHDDRVPEGVLLVLDQSGDNLDPGYSSFRASHAILFLSDDEA